MASAKDFGDEMKALAISMQQSDNERKREAARAVIQYLVDNTPVDTSKALSDWIVGIGKPASRNLGPIRPGEGGSTKEASGAAVLDRAYRKIRTSRRGQSIFISNDGPYIAELNDGSSTQTPAGFVERAVMVGRNVARKKR